MKPYASFFREYFACVVISSTARNIIGLAEVLFQNTLYDCTGHSAGTYEGDFIHISEVCVFVDVFVFRKVSRNNIGTGNEVMSCSSSRVVECDQEIPEENKQ